MWSDDDALAFIERHEGRGVNSPAARAAAKATWRLTHGVPVYPATLPRPAPPANRKPDLDRNPDPVRILELAKRPDGFSVVNGWKRERLIDCCRRMVKRGKLWSETTRFRYPGDVITFHAVNPREPFRAAPLFPSSAVMALLVEAGHYEAC